MGDQADPRRPETAILGGTMHLLGEIGGKMPVDDGNIDADLLEHLAAHHAHLASAAARPVPGGADEPARRAAGLVLNRLESCANTVAQGGKP